MTPEERIAKLEAENAALESLCEYHGDAYGMLEMERDVLAEENAEMRAAMRTASEAVFKVGISVGASGDDPGAWAMNLMFACKTLDAAMGAEGTA